MFPVLCFCSLGCAVLRNIHWMKSMCNSSFNIYLPLQIELECKSKSAHPTWWSDTKDSFRISDIIKSLQDRGLNLTFSVKSFCTFSSWISKWLMLRGIPWWWMLWGWPSWPCSSVASPRDLQQMARPRLLSELMTPDTGHYPRVMRLRGNTEKIDRSRMRNSIVDTQLQEKLPKKF